MQTAIAFILIFGMLVFFHELGHFLFAKRAGILVREFAIGMGPKIYGKTHGETMYTIRLLPIGDTYVWPARIWMARNYSQATE